MQRRDLFKGGLLGIFGWLFSKDKDLSTKEYKWGSIGGPRLFGEIPKKIFSSKIKNVFLDGEDVTNDCYYFNQKTGIVRLYKRHNNHFYMEYMQTKKPVEKTVDAEYAWVDLEGKKTLVLTNPIQLATKHRSGEVTIIEKT